MDEKDKKIWAIIQADFEGLHYWPDAINDKEISFLANLHRHIFKVIIFIEQKHTSRDIEYLKFKKWLEGILPKGNLGSASCEDIAERILSEIKSRYPDRAIKVIVMEDGENGALIEYK